MQEILVIAYYYPPQKGIGGKRIARWVKRLPDLGYRPVVLTTPLPPEHEQDNSLQEDKNTKNIEIIRAYSPSFFFDWYSKTNTSLQKSRQTIEKKPKIWSVQKTIEAFATSYYPVDPKIWFVPFAIAKARKIIKKRSIRAVLITSAPYSSMLIGLALEKIPLVLDLRDPWSFNFEMKSKAPIMRKMEAWIERKLFERADQIIVASKSTEKRYQEIYPFAKQKIHCIYSGFSNQIDNSLEQNTQKTKTSCDKSWSLPEPKPKVTLIHFGSFYGPRKLGNFVNAFANLIQERKLSPEDFRVFLFGGVSTQDMKLAESLGIRSFFADYQSIPYQTGLITLAKADALLYCDFGKEPYFILGKLFDYIAVKKPIVAISASQELRDLFQTYRLGTVCNPDDISSMQDTIQKLFQKKTLPSFQPENLEKLSSRKTTIELVDKIQQAINS